MKTTLENKNLPEILSLRQREAEVLTNLIQTNHRFARQAEDSLAQLYASELNDWYKRMEHQNFKRSAGLNSGDYKSAALCGFHKAANDYDASNSTAFKTWLYANIHSFCNDLAKKNEKKMKVELDEGRLSKKKSNKKSKKDSSKDSDKPKTISLEEIIGDESMAPKSPYTGPWTKYRASNQIAHRLKKIIKEKAINPGPCQKKAQRVQEFIEHVEADGNKVSFAEKTGCSRTTLDSNINFLLEKDPELKKMAKQVTRFWSKDSKRTKK